MPIDFARVPPKRLIPETPKTSPVAWMLLFVLIVGVGSTLSVLTWPKEQVLSVWFWLQTVVLPVLAWLALLFVQAAWFGAGKVMAIATNAVSDKVFAELQSQASKSLQLLGQSWCYSGDQKENDISKIVDRILRLEPTKVSPFDAKSIAARWIEIPGHIMSAGNAASERARHGAILEWMLSDLIAKISSPLQNLSKTVSLRVTLSLNADLSEASAANYLEAAIAAADVLCPVKVNVIKEPLSVFYIDTLLDRRDAQVIDLIIAVQLRRAISAPLNAGEAEGGAALLLSTVPKGSSEVANKNVHRPSKGASGFVRSILTDAAAWGKVALDQPVSYWTNALSKAELLQIDAVRTKSTDDLINNVDVSIGDCGFANSWLTLALAASQSQGSGHAQIMVVRESDSLFALTCRKA